MSSEGKSDDDQTDKDSSAEDHECLYQIIWWSIQFKSTLIILKVNLPATQASYEFGFAIILLIFASLSNMDDIEKEFPFQPLCLVLTWDVVDGDGEDQEDNSSPAASCMWNLFLLFTSCFLSVWAARMRSSPPLVHVSILYFICMKEENNVENKLLPFAQRLYNIAATKAHLSVHPEPSSASIKLLQCVISYCMLAQWNQKRRDVTHHNLEICVCFCTCFLRFPPINLNMIPPTVYNHMDAVIMCCDWDSYPPKRPNTTPDPLSQGLTIMVNSFHTCCRRQ